MAGIGTRIDETGTLVRDAEGLAFRRDVGGRYRLDLHRTPINEDEKRIRIVGILVADGVVDVVEVFGA